MSRQCSESVQTFQTMFKMFRICSDFSDNVQNVQKFQSMFRMFKIFSQCSECSEFSVNVQIFSKFLVQKLIYSEFLDFVYRKSGYFGVEIIWRFCVKRGWLILVC